MRKVGVSIIILLVMAFGFVAAAESQQNVSKVEKGFECLEEKVGDCSALTTQEIALTILATPNDNVFDDCVAELKDRKASDHWGNVRDTSLAILALHHAGESTQVAEEWLLNQTRTPTELEWYLEQDSNSETECSFGYDANSYNVIIGENKKLESNAGSCLTRAQSNFWLKISPTCYDNEFSVECDKDFIATLLYKNTNSPTIHILEGTDSSPAYGSIKLKVNSKCFGTGSCEYEATAWATIALLKTGHDVSDYIPYIVAIAETNERFLPAAFIYMATSYNDYATKLVSDVKLGNYWLAAGSAYDKFYDTALALVALGSSSSEQVVKSKDWLLFSQATTGCWQNSIRDTAIVLWGIEGRAGKSGGGGGGGSTTLCGEANYFCIPTGDCPSAENVGNNYFCNSLSETCCMNENLKTCSGYGGEVCTGDSVCTGNERRSSDVEACCTGECVVRPQETECEANFYYCMDSCLDSQESAGNYACDGAQVCCRTKTTSTSTSGSSLWWLWVLIILVVIAIVMWIFRENIRMMWFKMKSGVKKEDGAGPGPGGPGFGPRPGMPPRGMPPRRMIPRPGMPPQGAPAGAQRPQARGYDRRDRAMSDTFKKLRDMSG
ncbi:MAG: hypothetical protein NUV97_00715 [archaeon]|nr:hypothetical protein [archaeon]MCR4323351.1 hypothetical protein [Nanoarchaeota archaeon]